MLIDSEELKKRLETLRAHNIRVLENPSPLNLGIIQALAIIKNMEGEAAARTKETGGKT